jgi:hypothetical protein
MAKDKNLDRPMPCKASFVYGGSGERDKAATKILKNQGDLRAKKGQNNGR